MTQRWPLWADTSGRLGRQLKARFHDSLFPLTGCLQHCKNSGLLVHLQGQCIPPRCPASRAGVSENYTQVLFSHQVVCLSMQYGSLRTGHLQAHTKALRLCQVLRPEHRGSLELWAALPPRQVVALYLACNKHSQI